MVLFPRWDWFSALTFYRWVTMLEISIWTAIDCGHTWVRSHSSDPSSIKCSVSRGGLGGQSPWREACCIWLILLEKCWGRAVIMKWLTAVRATRKLAILSIIESRMKSISFSESHYFGRMTFIIFFFSNWNNITSSRVKLSFQRLTNW